MIYKTLCGERVSALGVGAMRLPVIGGDFKEIDFEATQEMFDLAMAAGINYFDTAWGYHEGRSEGVVGRAMAKYPRESWYLADKFPGYDISNMDKVKEIFEEQLVRCGVEYFDFYLVHNVCELNIEYYLNPVYGIHDYLAEQKRNGRIRHLGFSAHGSMETIKRYLAVYGDIMEFGQLQLNYLDWTFQNAKEKLELLEQRGLPVIVMEPLRGGGLCTLPEEEAAVLKSLRPEETVPGWAFRFLQGLPGAPVVLSGMSNREQLEQNIETFREDKPLSEAENEALLAMAKRMLEKKTLPCTSCRYCVEHCAQELDIPMLLGLYNEHVYTGGGFLAPMALGSLPDDKKPSACVGCGKCEEVCPQQLKISEAMADFVERLKPPAPANEEK